MFESEQKILLFLEFYDILKNKSSFFKKMKQKTIQLLDVIFPYFENSIADMLDKKQFFPIFLITNTKLYIYLVIEINILNMSNILYMRLNDNLPSHH